MAGQTQPCCPQTLPRGYQSGTNFCCFLQRDTGSVGTAEMALTPLCIQEAAEVPSCSALCTCLGYLLGLWTHLSLSTLAKPPQFPANRVRLVEVLLGSLKARVKKLKKFSWWQVYKTDARTQNIYKIIYFIHKLGLYLRVSSAQTIPRTLAEGNSAEGVNFCTNARIRRQIKAGLDRGCHLLLELNLDLTRQIPIPSEIHSFYSEDNRKLN